ncbi:MAG TPA: ammonium transporter [Longimicrobiales bacterium]
MQNTPLNAADTAWMMTSTALVLLMTPALAFFYGGLVRSKNVLNTIMMSIASLGVVGLAWALLGYSLAFAPGNALVGGLGHVFFQGVDLATGKWGAFPHLLFFAYQGSFAVIASALVSGSVVERMRFGAYLLFLALWSLLVYAPVAHWVWGGGWLSGHALDFAGGTVVHITAGLASVVAAVVVGQRIDYHRTAVLPHNVTYVVLGAALLWFGWFGFNGGSALAANETAVVAFVNTFLAPATTLLVWLLIDLWRARKATAVGAATAVVVGLVAITPAAGFVSPRSAILLGAIAAVPSYFALQVRSRTALDDSLDVFGAHGVGGIVGALLTGVFATRVWGAPIDGVIAGNAALMLPQLAGVVAAALYSSVMTFVILRVIALVIPLRRDATRERIGLDVIQHGEEAYSHGEGALLVIEDRRTKPRVHEVES